MKTLYLDCGMGAAGDMLAAALLELLPEKQKFIDRMNGLKIPGVNVAAEPSVKCGIVGTYMNIAIDGKQETDHGHDHNIGAEHHRNGMQEIRKMVSRLAVSEKVRADVLAIYELIAQAESIVHGQPVEQVHFSEIGAMDAVADIAAVCMLMEELAPDRVLASPVHVGCGQVRCAHGILPVPAPATAILLQGIPAYGGSVRGELCTPTGAALLRYFVHSFGDMPVMKVSKIGYGMGKKDFEAANCVRAFCGETEEKNEYINELCCNLDDMTPEAIGYAQERLFEGGALDVYTVAAGMKKNRPGVLLYCMCAEEKKDAMIRLMFKHTTTLGIREYRCRRYTLERTERTVETEHGKVRIKQSAGWGVKREKPEYEDAAKIARETDRSIAEVLREINQFGNQD